ncbi:MAG TPA: ATP-binding protein [Rudaea sp.]|jgi:signal transduction histidine kinase
MTIRKTLLVAFLSVGLISAIVLTSLAFVKAREALRAEIERNLAVEAAGIAADIDKMMFERLQNAAIWSRLDVMQDLQIRDVDKRLSRFLADLHAGYRDVYDNLFCVDTQGRVVSSSDITLIGTMAAVSTPWLKAALPGADVELDLQTGNGGVGVLMRVPLSSAFTDHVLGSLRLQLDWTEIYDVLDQASGGGSRMLAVLDRDGTLIAASSNLRQRGLLLSKGLAGWRQLAGAVSERNGTPLIDASAIVGAVSSHGYAQFAGFGWTTLIVQPVDLVLKPVHRMATVFMALLGLIALFTLLIAVWVSRAIARPIVALTGFARGYMRDKVLQAPASVGTGEVRELTDAFVQMVRDIDLSQQNLVHASKLAVVGEMSSIIAHEVRTPLGIIRSSAQMLQRESAISDEGREFVGFIESETERLNRLVSAMLDTARPRAPSFANVDMHDLIHNSVAMLTTLADKNQVQVSTRLLASRAVIECDEEQMTQVLLNLLMNCLQILHHGGRIEVATQDDGQQLRIEIADDGPGIDPTERARVFEAFFFKREGGIGLGLAIVQQIIRAHGGDIEAADSPLGGALFRIHLPHDRMQIS